MGELKKIEQRKKEREKKTQDLQKLITAADSNMENRRSDRKATKKRIHLMQRNRDGTVRIYLYWYGRLVRHQPSVV